MKLTAWIGAFLTIAWLAFLLADRAPRISAGEARARIAALEDAPDLHLVQTKQFKGAAVLGGRIEKKLRELFRINKRETPCVIEDYHFQEPAGTFTVQLLDQKGESARISVYGGPGASTRIGRLLRTTLPEADFVARP